MQSKEGLLPAAEVISGLDGPVKAIREASPQALHHYTRFDQVNQLVGAGEADADLGFMARMMALCSLPRTNPGDRIQYKRVNGPYTLYMTAGGGCKLPFGNFPRLLLAWVSGYRPDCCKKQHKAREARAVPSGPFSSVWHDLAGLDEVVKGGTGDVQDLGN